LFPEILMGIFTRPDSPFWWLYLETTKRRERTKILVDRGAPANRQAAARRAAEARYAARMLELAVQDTDRVLDHVGADTRPLPTVDASDPIPTSPWLNARAAARYLSKSRGFILEEVQAGRLRAAKIGGRGEILTRAEWLDEYVTQRISLAARRKLRRI
jgi:hypothetical protein